MIQIVLTIIFLTSFLLMSTSVLFKKFDIVDKPDGIRKIHKGNIPLGGGIAMFISFSLLSIFFVSESTLQQFDPLNFLRNIWLVSFIVLFLGLWDDIKPLPFSFRLIIQILASWLVIILTDIYIRDFGDLLGFGNIYVGELGIPLTIFMVVGVCNAFNMLDGMDGSVGFVLLITFLTLAAICYIENTGELFLIGSLVLICFLFFNLGFLGKNWKIFLGDSGSMWLGFITGWFLVVLTQAEGYKIFSPTTSLWLILLPLIDALSTFINRISQRKNIFLGDRSHLHHVLLDSGLKKWKVLLIFLVFASMASMTAIYFVVKEIEEPLQFYGFLTIWFFYSILMKTFKIKPS